MTAHHFRRRKRELQSFEEYLDWDGSDYWRVPEKQYQRTVTIPFKLIFPACIADILFPFFPDHFTFLYVMTLLSQASYEDLPLSSFYRRPSFACSIETVRHKRNVLSLRRICTPAQCNSQFVQPTPLGFMPARTELHLFTHLYIYMFFFFSALILNISVHFCQYKGQHLQISVRTCLRCSLCLHRSFQHLISCFQPQTVWTMTGKQIFHNLKLVLFYIIIYKAEKWFLLL